MKNKMKQLLLVSMMVMVFFTNSVNLHATDIGSYPYCSVYYRTPYYSKYQTKDIATLLDRYSTGNISKHEIIMSLIMQCNDCDFYYNDDNTASIECYNDNSDCVYTIYYEANGYLEISFYDAKYNGVHISNISINNLINKEIAKCKKNKRKYEINQNTYVEMATVNYKSITINNTRALLCINSSNNNDAPGMVTMQLY